MPSKMKVVKSPFTHRFLGKVHNKPIRVPRGATVSRCDTGGYFVDSWQGIHPWIGYLLTSQGIWIDEANVETRLLTP